MGLCAETGKVLTFLKKQKSLETQSFQGFSGGGWWIRTTEGIASRFTVCPLWPLGKSPIFGFGLPVRTGAGRRTRTPDLLITNQLLYQLSYTSTTPLEYNSKSRRECQQENKKIFFRFDKADLLDYNGEKIYGRHCHEKLLLPASGSLLHADSL